MSKRLLTAALLAAVVLGSVPPIAGASGAPGPEAATFEGTLELEISEQVADGRLTRATSHYFLSDEQGRRTPVTFAGTSEPPVGIHPGAKVRIQGHRSEHGIVAEGAVTPMADTGATGSSSSSAATSTAAAGAAGALEPSTKTLAVLLVNFASNPVQPYTTEYADGVLFSNESSVAAFFAEESYGAMTLTGDVSGWYTIDYNTGTCDTFAIQTKADAAAAAAGVDLTPYTHITYVFPHLNACSFAGRAQVPGRRSWINTISATTPKIHDWVVSHELGHNFGAHHANSYACTTGGVRVALSATAADCTSTEYGDPHTVMGAWNPIARYPHSHAWHRVQQGFMDPADRRTVSASGIYVLGSTRYEDSPTKALRIDRGNTAARHWFDIEFRQPDVLFDGFSSTSPVATGASIRLVADDADHVQSWLLDTTPSTTSFNDAPLAVGQTFRDPRSGIAVTTLGKVTDAAGNPALEVRVLFPNTPPPAAPTAFAGTSSDDGLTATLTWNPATTPVGVKSYRLYRDDALVATLDGDATTWADVDRVPGTTHAYRIEAVDWIDLVGASASTSVLLFVPALGTTTAAFAAPAAVARETASTTGDTQATLLTNAAVLTFPLLFSAPVLQLKKSALTFSGTATGCAIDAITGSGAEYSVDVAGCSDGSVALSIAAGTVRDHAGYLAPAADATSDTLVIDRTPAVAKAPAASVREGATLSGSSVPVRVTLAATDASGIERFEVARSVDGGAWATFAANTLATALDTTLTPGHTYRFRVRTRDGAGNVSPWIEGPLLKPGLTQNTSASITYRGTWSTGFVTKYSGGSARYTKSSTATASYTFTGRGIALVTTKAPGRGKVKVYLDGVYVRTIDLYRSSAAYRVLAFSQTFASAGTHTIKLVALGTSGRPRVDLDAFAVVR